MNMQNELSHLPIETLEQLPDLTGMGRQGPCPVPQGRERISGLFWFFLLLRAPIITLSLSFLLS